MLFLYALQEIPLPFWGILLGISLIIFNIFLFKNEDDKVAAGLFVPIGFIFSSWLIISCVCMIFMGNN